MPTPRGMSMRRLNANASKIGLCHTRQIRNVLETVAVPADFPRHRQRKTAAADNCNVFAAPFPAGRVGARQSFGPRQPVTSGPHIEKEFPVRPTWSKFWEEYPDYTNFPTSADVKAD